MKANSRRSSSTKRVRLVVIATLIIVVGTFVLPTVVHRVATIVLYPVTSVERWFRESGATLPVYLRDRAELQNTIASLEATLATQHTLQAERDTLADRVATLAMASSTAGTEMVLADVLAVPPYVPYDRLVINQGNQAGVVPGAAVTTVTGVVLGSVIETSSRQSVVELLSSAGLTTTVYVFGPDIYTTATGQGGGVLRIGVPQGVPVEVGNPVVVPAANSAVLGEISHIETSPTRPEQYAFVTMSVPLQQLRTVLAGRTAQQEVSFTTARTVVSEARDSLFVVPVPEGVLVDILDTATSTATSTASTTREL